MPETSGSPEDEEILEAVQALQGGASSDVFEVVFVRFFRPLRNFFANRPALREEAEDLAQATLQRAFERIHQYRPEAEASFGAWLRTIAENVWRNAVRERLAVKRALPGEPAELPAESQDESPNPEQAALAHERTRVLREALESLPPGMRRCTELRLVDDLKYQEIASLTGIGLNSVRSQLFEARQRLKPILDHYFQGADL
jgi:RNA polymerase sigma-70 factor (ECF subfamily)